MFFWLVEPSKIMYGLGFWFGFSVLVVEHGKITFLYKLLYPKRGYHLTLYWVPSYPQIKYYSLVFSFPRGRAREREREICICIYIYIYIHTHIYGGFPS